MRPERSEPEPSGGGSVRSADSELFGKLVVQGGELVLSDPALSLVAVIDREDRPLVDPPIRRLRMTAPEGKEGVPPSSSPRKAGPLPGPVPSTR